MVTLTKKRLGAQSKRYGAAINANKGSKRFGGGIDSIINSNAESKLGCGWRLCQTLETPNNPFTREAEKSVYKNCAQRTSSLRV